jgi:xanthine dehydrogenase accessory factor
VSSPTEVLIEAGRLAGEGTPYVLATVVAVQPPASTRRGDRALVLTDGSLVGWVGGACAEPIVIREALRALADGDARLVRIGPPGLRADVAVVVAESTCASEGVVDVLIEPQLPRRTLTIVGDGPVAWTLAELARTIDWHVTAELSAATDAVVVATMGHGDEDALEAALAAGADYVALVASARRAQAVLAVLRERGLDENSLARVRSPAGLDLGPSTQPEIAVAILAELVAWRHSRAVLAPHAAEATDPVCGMTVAVDARETSVHDGIVYAFCSRGCRERFEAEPGRYLAVGAAGQ